FMTSCGEKPLQQYKKTTTEIGFDTPFTFYAYTKSEKEFDQYYDQFKKEIYYYHQLFDKFNNYENVNNLKTINDNAGIQPIKVDQPLIDIITLSKEYYETSNHYFDISIGNMLNVWHQYREKGITNNQMNVDGQIPTLEELQKAQGNSSINDIIINNDDKTIYINNKNTKIDLGGIAKGYAIELVANKLIQEGLTSAIINGGGNVKTIGSKPNNEEWNVGITSPDLVLTNQIIDKVSTNQPYSFVTSGDYQRYYIGTDKKMYHHIINPLTLFPTNQFNSITIVTQDSGLADMLSTTLFIAPYSEHQEIINKTKLDIGVYYISKDQIIPQSTKKDNFYLYQNESLQKINKQ
ncbi:MAG: FAD:protein FMN transferase, partial [Erysipelotrichaceae bacterium]